MTVINTNVKALYTQMALKTSAKALSSAMQQLSTGKRINSAADDAAGLAISKRMSQQIRSLKVQSIDLSDPDRPELGLPAPPGGPRAAGRAPAGAD